jgi:hypothetical protein
MQMHTAEQGALQRDGAALQGEANGYIEHAREVNCFVWFYLWQRCC